MKKKLIVFMMVCIASVCMSACSTKDEKVVQADSADKSQIEEEEKKQEEQKKEEQRKKEEAEKKKAEEEKKKAEQAKKDPNRKVVYLTFDDGPSENTVTILNTLKKYNAKATFFTIYSKGNDDLYRRIVDEGHVMALHSFSHDYAKIYRSEEAFYADLDKIATHVKNVTSQEPKLIRFPGGSSNTISRHYCNKIMTKLSKSVTQKGYTYFDWNVSSGDASDVPLSASQIASNVINGTLNCSKQPVVLMHDAAAKHSTAEALDSILKSLSQKGYSFEGLDESVVVHHPIGN